MVIDGTISCHKIHRDITEVLHRPTLELGVRLHALDELVVVVAAEVVEPELVGVGPFVDVHGVGCSPLFK